ncbi:MAG: rod shape-determining protein MreD [Acidobacteriota bacterium]
MTASRYFVGLALAVLAHAVAARWAPGLISYLDFFVVLTVLTALSGDPLQGLLGGFLVGNVQDSMTVGLFGLYGFANTLVGYVTAKIVQRIVIERAMGVFPMVAGAVLAQQLIVLALTSILLPSPPLPNPIHLVLRAVACGVLGSVLFALGGWWRGRSARRRRSRMDRVHLG